MLRKEQTEFPSAWDISEEVLRKSSKALDSECVDALMECFCLPCRIETFEHHTDLTTKGAFRSFMTDLFASHERIGITHIIRTNISANFLNDTTIVSTHETRVLRHRELIMDPFPVMHATIWDGTAWKIKTLSSGVMESVEISRLMSRYSE